MTISTPDATALLRRLCEVIDAHAWDVLPELLHEDFRCLLVHTGETFDRAEWVRLNAEYPGFERLLLQDLVGSGERAVSRAHVVGRSTEGEELHHEVATFLTARDGSVVEITEVWTDVGQAAPEGTRPAPVRGA